MESIKDFVPTQEKEGQKQLNITKTDLQQTKEDYSDLIELFLSRYGDMDEDKLIAEMLRLINEKKKQGTYNAQELKMLDEKVKPFLDAEQTAKMEELLKYL